MIFHISGQMALAVQPGEGALHHPAARQQIKALGPIRPLDDLDRPAAVVPERVPQLISA